MELYINDLKVDYELENEKNSYDIISAVSEYAAKSDPKHFITTIYINDKEYSFSDISKLKSILISEVEKINIETGDVYGITSLSIEQIEKFLKLLKEVFLSNNWNEILNDINDSIKWMKEGLNQIIRIYDPNDENVTLEKQSFFKDCNVLCLAASNLNRENFHEINNENAINSINNLIQTIFKIKKWLIFTYKIPDRNFVLNTLSSLIIAIDDISPQLENVPVMFQTGEDREAMFVIQRLTDILENSIGLFVLFKETFNLHMDQYSVKEVAFEDFFKALTDHLKELMGAIKSGDSVMIGDLLEYEFVPNVEEIKNILIRIKGEAFIRAN